MDQTALYPGLLGQSFELLPPEIQAMHRVDGRHSAKGRGRVVRGKNPLSRLLAAILRMPKSASNIPVAVTFSATATGETITRNYDGTILITHQSAGGMDEAGLLRERFGPVTMLMSLTADSEGLTFQLRHSRFLGLPLPRILWPKVTARERVQMGEFHYFVTIALPFLGQLIEYEGQLTLDHLE